MTVHVVPRAGEHEALAAGFVPATTTAVADDDERYYPRAQPLMPKVDSTAVREAHLCFVSRMLKLAGIDAPAARAERIVAQD